MDFVALLTMETGGHYVAVLTADWSYHVNLFALQFLWCGIHQLITDITSAMVQRDKYNHLFSYSQRMFLLPKGYYCAPNYVVVIH